MSNTNDDQVPDGEGGEAVARLNTLDDDARREAELKLIEQSDNRPTEDDVLVTDDEVKS
jgi:hypothetical protein